MGGLLVIASERADDRLIASPEEGRGHPLRISGHKRLIGGDHYWLIEDYLLEGLPNVEEALVSKIDKVRHKCSHFMAISVPIIMI